MPVGEGARSEEERREWQQLGTDPAAELARRVTSGDVTGAIGTVPEALQASIGQIGSAAFADGFAAALLLVAIAAVMALLTLALVRRAETMPVTVGGNPLQKSGRPKTGTSRAGHGEPATATDRVGLAE